ncbi:MAG TPA: hypothetical protein VI362_03115 [Ignavibacteriaceae bacterium]|nr:hypothetical protein [Ignavibacteriaceae bacterium]
MNTGEMFLTLGGIFLLTMLIMNVNKATGFRIVTMYSNETIIEATGVAEALLEDIQTKSFDEETISKPVTLRNLLTLNNLMGPDSGESSPTQFDDIDDYNNYSIIDSVNGMGEFGLSVNVYYVSETDPLVQSSVRTYLKCVDVTITNISLPNTLIFKRLISY